MSPKRERRQRARREADRRSESRIQWLGILLVVCGVGMLLSGLYLLSTILGIAQPTFLPPLQRFWQPTPLSIRVGAIGDLLAGAATIALGTRGIRKPLTKRLLYVVMGCAVLGLASDMLGGLYAIFAQATWYLTLFTVLFRR